MADKIKFLVQKRTSLKSQITNLANIVEEGKIDNATLRLRNERLTQLYRAFEEYNDELAVLDPNANHRVEFEGIQERFYSLAGKIESILRPGDAPSGDMSETSASVSNEGVRRDDVVPPVEKRRIKLPETPLPKFNGRFEEWLSFRNAFCSMIGSRTDLAEIDKLHYLRSALTDEAANKIRIFEIDGINYAKAWSLLERSYEVRRILISRHLSLLSNLPALNKETTNGLSSLADDAQQHVASLNSLGVSVGHEMIVPLLETKLPRITLEKWEATLERDEFPEIDQMYEFLYKTAVCVSRRERAKVTDMEGSRGEPSSKKGRSRPSNRARVVSAARNCIACKTKRHPLYLCDKFKQLPIPKRIETVRNAKACYNCLRSHRDTPCTFSNCTICQRKHNTLLHLDQYPVTNRTSTSKAVDTQAA
ncbi:PREDICTED: uncharacterized protein LOC105569808 [Vollenhovia emeryi]|uniref:uncharacterized protein LOC105569808 n=1 Tax=Vollenhovia emeryi TaxID=411798 RepID=UPI0005F44866|nr:PREDICTED: uncharacterized protein LOC105569808 [Vollenhovia emeryi]